MIPTSSGTSPAPPSLLWTGFICALILPLFVSLASPLPFAFFLPAIALAFMCLYVLKFRQAPKLDWVLLAWIAAIGGLGCLSSLWSLTPSESLDRGLKISALLLFSVPLIDLARACPPEALRRSWIAFPLLTLLLGALCAVEIIFGMPLYRIIKNIPPETRINPSLINKSACVFTLMLPVCLFMCLKRGVYTLAALLVITAGLLFMHTESQASQIAMLVMPLALGVLLVLPVAGIPLAFAATGFVILLMPFLSPIAFDMFAQQIAGNQYLGKKASASMRLENWDFISRKIMENPWTGFGMDATRSIQDFETQQLFFKGTTIMHPHNFGLQMWIEFGVIGVALILGFLGFLMKRLLALPQAERRLPFMLFCGGVVFLMISWSVWSAWLLAFIVYLAVLMVLAAKTTSFPSTS